MDCAGCVAVTTQARGGYINTKPWPWLLPNSAGFGAWRLGHPFREELFLGRVVSYKLFLNPNSLWEPVLNAASTSTAARLPRRALTGRDVDLKRSCQQFLEQLLANILKMAESELSLTVTVSHLISPNGF